MRDLASQLSDFELIGPIFFASLALYLDFDNLPTSISLFAALLLAAVGGKFLGTYFGSRIQKIQHKKALAIGTFMNSRGTLDIIIITLAVDANIFNNKTFSVLLILAFTATLFAALGAKPLKKNIKPA